MYYTRKKLSFSLLVALSVMFFSGCKTCNNQKKQERLNTLPTYIIPDSTRINEPADKKAKFKFPPENLDKKRQGSDPSSEEDIDLTADDSIEEAYIYSLKKEIIGLDDAIKALRKIIDYKLQKLFENFSISAEIKEKIKQALENLQEINRNKKYEEIVYEEALTLIQDIDSQNILPENLQSVIENLKIELKSIKILATKKFKIKEEHELKTAAKRINHQLQKLLQSPEIPADMGKKVKQVLENQQLKKKNGDSMTYVYEEVVNLVNGIQHQNINLSKSLQSLIEDIKLDYDIIIILESRQGKVDTAR